MKGIQVQEIQGKQAQEVIDSDFSPLANVPEWTLVEIEKDKVTRWAELNKPVNVPRRADLWADVGKR